MIRIYKDKAVQDKKELSNFIILFLILFGVDFFLKGIHLLLLGFVILIIVKFQSKIRINKDFWILYIFAMTYFFFSSLSGLIFTSDILKVSASPVAFFIGMNIYRRIELEKIKNIIYILAISMALHGILNFLYNIRLFGFANSIATSRSYDFWSRAISSSTAQATKFTLLVCIFFFVIFIERNLKIRILLISMSVLSFLYNLQLGGRSYILLLFLSIVSGILILIFYSGKLSHKIWNLIKVITIFSLVSIFLALLYENNVGGIQETIKSSYIYHRFFSVSGQSVITDSRLEKKIEYVKLIIDYPWGGRNISIKNGLGSAHELWLDIFDSVGIIPFTFIWLYTISSWKRLFSFINNRNVEIGYKVLLGTIYFVMSVQFFIEPIMDGSPKLFLSYCIIDGMISNYLTQSN